MNGEFKWVAAMCSSAFYAVVMCRVRANVFAYLFLIFSADALWALSPPVLSVRQNEIMRTAMSASGYITPDMHREFWAEFPDKLKNDAQFLDYSARKLTALYGYHREVIASARLSLKAKKIVLSDDYDVAKAAFLLVDAQEPTIFPGSTVAYGEAFIRAAATGISVRGPDELIIVDAKRIDDLDGSIDGSLARMQILLRPEWSTTPKEYVNSELNIAVLSDVPFTNRRRPIQRGKSVIGAMTILFRSLDEERTVSVAKVAFDIKHQNTRRVLNTALEDLLHYFDVGFVGAPRVERWRDRLSVQTRIYVISADSNAVIIARAVFRKADSSVVVLLSRSSQAHANDTFDRLEKSVRLLDSEKVWP